MVKKLAQVYVICRLLFFISLLLIFPIIAVQVTPDDKMGTPLHPSHGGPSADLGQTPPKGNQPARQSRDHLSYEALNPQFACNETRSGSCGKNLNPPAKQSCNHRSRTCLRP
ncbi:uncharacterized protein LOC116003191 [Ipomoea triloba]|uniref:uncharacterized protein LOC116003191 n=1 Tax=Ipomoea triloba TaxID=35885 RepID=UPI00125D1C17|nr:uncharacterized protein LOC116003191 [Ipomoea triloba]